MEVSTIESNIRAHEKKKRKKRWYHYMFGHLVPTEKSINMYFTQLIFLAYFCVFLYGLLKKNALPGSQVFAVLFMAFIAVLGGKVIGLLKLPPLLGMMIVGFLFRNLDFIPYYGDISHELIAALKLVALAYILLRGGLGVDVESLKKMKFAIIRLSFIPCLAEACTIAVVAHFLLSLPWLFSSMLGFIISAISEEVVLPVVIYLKDQGYGVKKGISTLVIAATALDDIWAIAGFTIFFSIAFSTSDLVWTILKGPLEPLVGFTFGTIFGIIFWYLPSKDMKMFKLVYYNVLLVSFAAMANILICEKVGIPGAGPLGCITVAFVSSISWRKDEERFAAVVEVTSLLWNIIQPFLFVLIGAEITIVTLRDTLGYGILTLLLGLIFRFMITILVCSGIGLNLKEKIFVCCAWIPKATVQAAIGSYAMDYAKTHSLDKELVHHGIVVLNISILSIMLTAPLGASLIRILGPIYLTRDIIPNAPSEAAQESSSAKQGEELTPKGYDSLEADPSKDSLLAKP